MFVVMAAGDGGLYCKSRGCKEGCFQLCKEGGGESETRAIRGRGTAAQSS